MAAILGFSRRVLPFRSAEERQVTKDCMQRMKEFTWQRDGICTIRMDDARLTVVEREVLTRIGNKLFGPRDN